MLLVNFFCIHSIISIHKMLSVMYQLILKHQICWAQNWFLGLKINFWAKNWFWGPKIEILHDFIHLYMYGAKFSGKTFFYYNLRYMEIHPKWTIHVGYSWKCVILNSVSLCPNNWYQFLNTLNTHLLNRHMSCLDTS